MPTFAIYRQLPPVPSPWNEWEAHLVYAGSVEARSAAQAIQYAKSSGIAAPVVERME